MDIEADKYDKYNKLQMRDGTALLDEIPDDIKVRKKY